MLTLESKNCSIMAKSAGGEGEDEIEIELELGLSIGRSYKKSKPEPDSNTTINGVVSSFMGCFDDDDLLRLSEKREIHALRRQEAKKKREARRQVKRSNLFVQPESKKSKGEDSFGSGQVQVVNVKNVNQSLGFAVHPYPCAKGGVVMPLWMTGGAGAGAGNKERNVIQPVARYGSCPLQVLSDTGFNLGTGYESERNGGNEKMDVGSDGSSMCNSSAGSDCRSTSYEGGGSCDTRSHSSHTTRLPEDANAHLRHGATSVLKESTNNPEKVIPSNTTAQSSTISPNEDLAKPVTGKMSSDESPSSSGSPSKECIAKPLKPEEQNQNSNQLPYMPCVSTTGNGPNGRTINGFLYRYTKAEVSIVCICHGSSFSPAEFVLHAGGTDVSHPLRHITVIPSVI